ncbi:MAG: glycosyltransferase family 2 protein [Candidatus Hydrogenedentes bacterium]|nr:glycosyltransferase family 2 protein [Candidatus Hydrogenedentota bacterium]
MDVSFVIPVRNEQESLRPLIEEILEHAPTTHFEILLVNDGSTDGSTETIDELAEREDAVQAVHLDRHLGKSAALAAGFARAQGSIVITMDSDLQDEAAEIPRFIVKVNEGFDLVCGWKSVRHDSLFKRVASRVYNRWVGWLFSIPLHDINCGFKAMRREVIETVPLTKGMHRLFPVLALRAGYSIAELPVTHRRRPFGRSKYGPGRYVTGFADVIRLWWQLRD